MDLNLINTAGLHRTDAQTTEATNALNRPGKADEIAESFEAMVIAQMLGPMFNDIKTDGPFGGGFAENIFRSVMVDEIGKSVAKRGGIGIADSVRQEILVAQEAAQQQSSPGVRK